MLRIKASVVLIILFGVGGFLWWRWATAPVDPKIKETKIFVIPPKTGVRQIAQKLKRESLIRDQIVFFLLVKVKGLEKNIQAGDYRLSPSMDPATLLTTLTHGTLDVWVTIPEGWRSEEIAQKLFQTLGIPQEGFLKVSQEGYMFPDTYLIPKEASAGAVAKMMLSNFQRRWEEGIGLKDQREIVTLASIVEREVKEEKDRPIVSGILLKRLKNGMSLDVDATVQYAVANLKCQISEGKCDWWPKKLTSQDLKINSPYNTYLNPGLPPTPIANPGLSSLQAAAFPKETDYWYYLSDKTGKIHYARTLEEHNQNIEKYLLR